MDTRNSGIIRSGRRGAVSLAVFLFSLFLGTQLAHGDSWEEVQPEGDVPDARYGQSIVEIDGKAYIFGGAEGSGVELNDLWVFKIENSEWEKTEPENDPPRHRKLHTAVAYNRKMYVFFGVGEDGEVLSDVCVYDAQANTWEQLAQGYPWPAGRWGHCAVVVGHRVMIFAGMGEDGYPRGDTWSLNLLTGEWDQEYSFDGLAFYGHSAVERWGGMHVFGGQTYNPGKDLWSYSNDTWSYWTGWDYVNAQGEMPPERAFHATAVKGDKMWIFGGRGSASGDHYGPAAEDAEIDLQDTYEFDFTSNTWTRGPDLPIPLCGSAAVALETETGEVGVYIFGGTSNGEAVGKMWVYWPDREPKPAITEVETTDTGEVQLTWPSLPDETYTVWSRLDLVTGEWVQEETLQSEGESTSYTLSVPPARAKYYRIEIPAR